MVTMVIMMTMIAIVVSSYETALVIMTIKEDLKLDEASLQMSGQKRQGEVFQLADHGDGIGCRRPRYAYAMQQNRATKAPAVATCQFP